MHNTFIITPLTQAPVHLHVNHTYIQYNLYTSSPPGSVRSKALRREKVPCCSWGPVDTKTVGAPTVGALQQLQLR